ncbi:MAG TPA: hypothetical protein VGG06_21165 [Thermoanaerobaculia bacterium]|jgi:hypothetical protein
MRHLTRIALVVVLALPVATAEGKLDKSVRKQIKSALQGTLYLRMDAPCATGRHSFGTYVRPLVEVSPEGSNTEAENEVNASWWHADSTYWGIRINDPVELDEFEMEPEENALEIELAGVGPAEDNSTVVRFVDIHSFEDFQAAFDRTFARAPLQDEHDDWPAETKQAIADRRLVNGMGKRQVFYVTGAPESFEKKTEDGKEVEIWNLRQNKGMKLGFFGAKMGETTGLPATIRFEDGQLVDAAATGTRSNFSLDDD